MEKKSLSVGDIGEFGLIERVTAGFSGSPDALLGPGDDGALVATTDGSVVVSTDLLVEGRHFRLDWSSPYDVGRKAAAQSLADVAAMGARPTALLVGLAAPDRLAVEVAEALAQGLAAECRAVGCSVVGGDIVRADELLLAVTALGALDGRAAVRRSGARVGDRIVVAGQLGGSAAGLAAFSAGEGAAAPAELLDSHRCPSPPYEAGPLLNEAGATAMVDTSDGFAADLGHILRASGVAAVVDVARLPRHPALAWPWAAEHGESVVAGWITSGGEDHALVATLPPAACAAAVQALTAVDIGLVDVGEVVAGEGTRWVGLPPRSPEPAGFDHFGGSG